MLPCVKIQKNSNLNIKCVYNILRNLEIMYDQLLTQDVFLTNIKDKLNIFPEYFGKSSAGKSLACTFSLEMRHLKLREKTVKVGQCCKIL